MLKFFNHFINKKKLEIYENTFNVSQQFFGFNIFLKEVIIFSQLIFIRTLRDSKYLVRIKIYEYSNIRFLKKNIKNRQ